MKRMKKIYLLLLFLSFHSYFCKAQQAPNDNDNQRIEVIKMAFISRDLNLSPQESQNFWPVYNNYQNELKQARLQYPDNEIEYDKKVVEIKQRYQESFKKVLGNDNQRLNKVYTTDKKFRDMMRTELQNRQKVKQQQTQKPPNNNFNNDKGVKNNPKKPRQKNF